MSLSRALVSACATTISDQFFARENSMIAGKIILRSRCPSINNRTSKFPSLNNRCRELCDFTRRRNDATATADARLFVKLENPTIHRYHRKPGRVRIVFYIYIYNIDTTLKCGLPSAIVSNTIGGLYSRDNLTLIITEMKLYNDAGL